MSNSTETDSPQRGSLLSNLRHFRFQKKSGTTSNTSTGDSESETSEQPKMSNYTNGASSDSNKSPNKNFVSDVALKTLKEYFPTISPLVLERSLIRCKGDIASARILIREEYYRVKPPCAKLVTNTNKNESVTEFKTKLLENFNKKCSNVLTQSPEKQSPVKRSFTQTEIDSPSSAQKKIKKERKRIAEFDESGDSDDEGYNKQDRRVFDSDEDSDMEISDDMNTEQRKVYDFLSTAELSELLCMPNCSQKKAEAIIEQRPFTGWKNMVEKFQEGKNLGTEILNSAQEVLYTRQVVNQLMQKCSRLAVEMERAVAAGTSNITVQPQLLSPSLKLASYQMVGLNWLVVLHNRGVNGILADEMGLGKTVQIIAFLAYLIESAGQEEYTEPNLIVVPSSTLDNWSNELERWCPSMKVFIYYGSQEERKAMRIQFSQHGIKDYNVLLTTYNLITSSPEEKKMFKVLPFNYVVFDEAHMLKNMNTQRFEHLMKINAKHRILLTGTPLQNNLLELMSLLTFVMPEMFAKKKEYLKCLFTKTPRSKTAIDTTKDSLPRFEQEQVARAKKIMQPFVLRRLKKDVLKDLPEKSDELIFCEMVEEQKARYINLISAFSNRAKNKDADDKSDIDEQNGMSMMMDLRKLSNHPLLLRYHYDDLKIAQMAKKLAKEKNFKEKNETYIREDLSVLSDFQLHMLAKSFASLSSFELQDEDILYSGKFRQLDKMLPKLKEENHRVLIFSQFVIMLNVVEEYLKIKGYKYLRLDGSTQVTIRQELIDNFNEDPSIFVFILSTRAGGLGINLTAADTVIIHDIDFNPYNDKQAEDRCHRVGQTKPVSVIRFICKDSIEENIYQVALEKLSLEKEISSEDGEHSDLRSVVSLLKKVLGLEGAKASPQKKPTTIVKQESTEIVVKVEPDMVLQQESQIIIKQEPGIVIKQEPDFDLESQDSQFFIKQEPEVLIKEEPGIIIKQEPPS